MVMNQHHNSPAPLLRLYEQQNCADWFIPSMRRLIVGNCCILQLLWPCIRCCSWPLTPHPSWWEQTMRFEMAGIVSSSFLPLIQFSHNVILSYRYHYCCLIIWSCSSQSLDFGHHQSEETCSQMSNGPNKLLISSVQSLSPPKRSITRHNLSLWKLAKHGATIYS